jgi:glycosyltransferase involved in cell wall biosynthesis
MRVWLPRLQAMGHDLAVSCLAGPTSYPDSWRDIPLYPMTPYENFGQDVVAGHYAHFKADLCITLTCTWVFNPLAWRDMRVIHITPVDIEGMSAKDYAVISQSGGMPAAVCRWGEAQMKTRGLEPLYLPHGIETSVFKPPEDRQALRRAQGIDHLFVTGICAANNDKQRKHLFEAIAGWAAFHGKHPKSVLLLHTAQYLPGGLKLFRIVQELGIEDACVFSDQYQLMTGMVSDEALAAWYGACDVLLNVGNEGFGLPGVEAQACGTPVINAGWGPGPELCGAGWTVKGQPDWNDLHEGQWKVPLIASIAGKLGIAYKHAAEVRSKARDFAFGWDADRGLAEHWRPVFDSLG